MKAEIVHFHSVPVHWQSKLFKPKYLSKHLKSILKNLLSNAANGYQISGWCLLNVESWMINVLAKVCLMWMD